MEEDSIKIAALAFAKAHKKTIAKNLTDPNVFVPEANPVVVFMAGSPGAGKTEASQQLIRILSKDSKNILRIDSDDIRPYIPGYTGTNSSLFQNATSIIVDRMQDLAISNKQSYIFDGTLTNEKRSRENITRCLKHGYEVHILYVYQDPLQAWEFVKARERKDGRNVPANAFVEQYFKARENVNSLKKDFGKALQIDLIVKNIDGTDFQYAANIPSVDTHITERYTREELCESIKNIL